MKTILKCFGLLCVVTLFVACSQNKAPTPYKITGEFKSMLPEVTDVVVENEESSSDNAEMAESDADAQTEVEPEIPIDLSNATLTISYDTTNSEGIVESVTLVEEPFTGTFEYEGETKEPTEVTISLKISEDSESMDITTVIGTGHDVHFSLFDHPQPRNDEFVLLGTSSQSMDAESKFSISGDLNAFDDAFKDHSVVSLRARTTDDDGEIQYLYWGPVMVHENSFQIEGDVEEPLLATLSIRNSQNSASTSVILEPQGEVVVEKLGNQTRELGTSSSDGLHTLLVSSWQQNEEYVALVDSWTAEYELYLNPPEPTETEGEAESMEEENAAEETGDEEVADVEEQDDSSSEDSAENDEESTETVASVEPAEGCEDADVGKYVEPRPSTPSTSGFPEWYNMQMQAREIRNTTLREIVEGDHDRTAQHIAMKMRPYTEDSDALAAWKLLSEKFEAEYVAMHITPEVETIEKRVLLEENDSRVVPGQKAPAFTLANLEGEDVSLYNLLGEKDMVLIDFWASWCGPCIADFPDLKKLYTAYSDEDFEIVGVSIDSTHEDWVGGVEDNELPWAQLGELEGWYGHVGVQYGVGWIPKGYLVDSQGCIYEKDIRPAALKAFLVDRYGMDDSLEQPDIETDDSQGVSG